MFGLKFDNLSAANIVMFVITLTIDLSSNVMPAPNFIVRKVVFIITE